MKTVKTNHLTGRALDWVVAGILGYVREDVVRATDADLEGKILPFKLYGERLIIKGDQQTWEVEEIIVTRYDCLPGCTGKSITFHDTVMKRKAYGSPNMFYLTREMAQLGCQQAAVGHFEEFDCTDQGEMGLMIDKYLIDTAVGPQENGEDGWYANMYDRVNDKKPGYHGSTWIAGGDGPTRLIAAARCLAVHIHGPTVEIPEEL